MMKGGGGVVVAAKMCAFFLLPDASSSHRRLHAPHVAHRAVVSPLVEELKQDIRHAEKARQALGPPTPRDEAEKSALLLAELKAFLDEYLGFKTMGPLHSRER